MSDQIPEVNAGRRRKSSSRPTTQAERPVRRPAGAAKPSAKPTRPSYPSGSSSSGSGGLGGLGGLTGSSGSRKSCGGGIFGILILVIVLYFLLRSCGGGLSLPGMTDLENEPAQNVPVYTEPTQAVQPGRQPSIREKIPGKSGW